MNYSTCGWHGSGRTYPRNTNSHVICKVKKKNRKTHKYHVWLVVTGTWLVFFHILGMSSSQLTFIFFRGVAKPPTRWCDLCKKDAKHIMSTISNTLHVISHMKMDTIWVHMSVYDILYIYIYNTYVYIHLIRTWLLLIRQTVVTALDMKPTQAWRRGTTLQVADFVWFTARWPERLFDVFFVNIPSGKR